MQDSLSVYSLEGKKLEVVTAEAIQPGDLLVAGGEKCGIREVIEVRKTWATSCGDEIGFEITDVYETRGTFFRIADDLIIRVAKSS